IIINNIPVGSTGKGSLVFDAGGGTGRWACNLSQIYKKTRFIVYDLSVDMLNKANLNIKNINAESRITVIHGDLTKMDNIKTEYVDHIVSIYSPISFIYKKHEAFKEMYRILKPGGSIIIMGHGFYNALYSKIQNYHAHPKELDALDEKKLVKWTDYVPKLNVFSQEIMEAELLSVGFSDCKSYGVPVFVQPEDEDFDPSNTKKSRISRALENEQFFQKILELEMKYNSIKSVVNRGVNIFTLARKFTK
ncbi:MAG: class I SAM-dependent methyltransferase, partial [Clostridiales Family XIII bacterium]|nr:class I SAM-dependent methyltransferase [Clostridiales Family XIII bacterium]